MAYTESDPLLPGTRSAPEISTNGSSPAHLQQHSTTHAHNSAQVTYDDLEEERQQPSKDVNSALVLALAACLWVAVLVNIAFPGRLGDIWRDLPWNRLTIEARVDRILLKTPLIDGHNDLAIVLRFLHGNHIYDQKFTGPFENGGLYGHVDLPRLRKGKVGGTFWSAYIGCPKDGDNFEDENYAEAVHETYQQIDVLQRLFTAYPDDFSLARSSSSAFPIFSQGRIISPIGIEGLHQIGNSYSHLRSYFALGVRYATLTHNCHNIYADAALTATGVDGSIVVSKPLHGGLSDAGIELIKEMNRMGMIVDLAHVSHDTMLDVLGGNSAKYPEGSAAPVIFSHSSAYALCAHPRNVPDHILKLVKAKNSLVMVNFSPIFISCIPAPANSTTGIPEFYPPNSTIEYVVEHIKYIGDFIGYAHVGFGSDFDGIFTTPQGLDDVSKFPLLVAEMLRQGISDVDASKVVGGNLLRVWSAVETVAARLQREKQIPKEDPLRAIFKPPVG